jgi:hypothetical protein
MTREEAIDILDDNFTVIDTHGHYTDEEVEQARQMAIEALGQEPCEDAISRQAVLDYIGRLLNQGTGKKKSFEFIQKYVKELQSVTPQYTDAEIQKMQELEQAEIEKAYELGKASQPKTRSEQNV